MLTTTVFLEHLNKLYSCMVVSVGWLKPKHGIQKKKRKVSTKVFYGMVRFKGQQQSKGTNRGSEH